MMFAGGASAIPFRTLSALEPLEPSAILVTTRNLSDVIYYGAD
jgi:hypothetical protein